MTSAEFQEWRAYYTDEPFGDLRDDFRNGVICSLVSNLTLSKNRKPAVPNDFITHSDAHGGQAFDQAEPVAKRPKISNAAQRRKSQKDQIAAMKSTLRSA